MSISKLESNIMGLIEGEADKFSISIAVENEIININADRPKKAASLIKVPILIEAFRQVELGVLDPDELVYIDTHMKVGGGGVINQMTNSNIYTYLNLLELMIIVSDNTAANMMLEKVGMAQANQLAEQLGCYTTRLQRRFMDFKAQKAGLENYTSARDMQLFLQVITSDNDILDKQSREQIRNIMSNQQLRHKLGSFIPDEEDFRLYSKSGELPGTENDAAVITYKDKQLHAAILSEGWSNNGTGSHYIAEIGKLLFEYIKQ